MNEPVDDSIFSPSFVLFRLCAGMSFSFEHLEQNGTAFVDYCFKVVSVYNLVLNGYILENDCVQHMKVNIGYVNAFLLEFSR